MYGGKQPVPFFYGQEIASSITNTTTCVITDTCVPIRTSEQLVNCGITSKVQCE